MPVWKFRRDPDPEAILGSPSNSRVNTQIMTMPWWSRLVLQTPASEAGLRENLDMLEERRAKVHLKNLHYQRVVARLYNQRI
ncbi:hypothetical protein GW17_00059245 [Ensete ventricosum]|nr:hypothetical protein GW17_00059245 [Ensete ventricosum]